MQHDQEVETFYDELKEPLEDMKSNEVTINRVDLNPEVGNMEVEGIVGKYAVDEGNNIC